MERKTALFSQFNGGQMSSFEDEKIPVNAAKTAQNCIIETDGTVSKRDIASFIERVGADTGTVVNHCRYTKSSGASYDIIATSLGKVFYRLQGTAATYTEITGFVSGFGTTNDINMLSFSDVIWLVDGVSGYTWDGTTLTKISDGGSAYWEAAYNDPKYIEASQGVIYLAGISDDPVALYHSVYWNSTGAYLNPTSADAWDSTQVVKLPVSGEKITALKNYHDKLFITTAKRVFVISGYVSQINPQLVEVYSEDGCIDNKTFREINGNLYWVGQRGVYRFNGSAIELISEGIKEYFEWLRASTNNRLRLNLDSKESYDTFSVLTNCDIDAVPNSIVSVSYPKHNKIKDLNSSWTRGGGIGVGQDIIFEDAVSGALTVRFNYYMYSSASRTCTVKLTKEGEGSATYTTTVTLAANTSSSYTKTTQYATFSSVDIDPDSAWFISFEINSDSADFWLYTGSNELLGTADTIRTKATVAGAWVDLSGQGANEILDILIMPATSTMRTDVSLLSTLLSTQRFSVATDDNYADEGDTSWTFQYRTGASEAACLAASWTTLSGNDVDISLTNSPAANTYIQFQIVATNDTTDLTTKYSSIKVDGISLAYLVGTAVTNRLFGFTHLGRYYLALPREGYSYNDRVFVLNYNGGWTYFDLRTHCLWEQDGLITYGRSDSNEVYQLSETDSQITDQWNSQTDWQSESEDSYCDDATTAGSLQALVSTDANSYSDSFGGSTVDSKWLNNDYCNYTESDGVLWKTISNPNEINKVYQNIIGSDYYVSVKIGCDGIPNDTNATEVVGLILDLTRTATDVATVPVTGYAINLWRNVSDGFIKIKTYGYSGGVAGSTTNTDTGADQSGGYIWLKITREIVGSSSTLTCYWSNDGDAESPTWNLIVGESFANISTSNRVSLIGWQATTEIHAEFDDFIFDGTSYIDGSYRIYPYSSNGSATIYWEGTDASSTNTITIYHASRHSTAIPDDATLEEIYEWTLLGTITSASPNGSTTFTTTNYKYIKIVFNLTDTSYTPLIGRLYMITDENVEMIWETGMMEYDSHDNEKYLRKVYVDAESEGGLTFYYKTEKMDEYRSVTLASGEKRTSLPVEHGQKVQWKLISDNALTCNLKHIQLEYKEHKLR